MFSDLTTDHTADGDDAFFFVCAQHRFADPRTPVSIMPKTTKNVDSPPMMLKKTLTNKVKGTPFVRARPSHAFQPTSLPDANKIQTPDRADRRRSSRPGRRRTPSSAPSFKRVDVLPKTSSTRQRA